MSLVGKFVSELLIKAPGQKFYEFFKDKISDVSNISPMIQKIEIYEDRWDNHGHGSIKIWNYTVDGKQEVFKERVEFDDKNLLVTYTGLDGDVFNHYKVFKAKFQVVPKGPNYSSTILTLEYEKHDDGSPYPYKYLDLMNNLTKDIESHFNK